MKKTRDDRQAMISPYDPAIRWVSGPVLAVNGRLNGKLSSAGRICTKLYRVCAKIASAMQCIFENQWTSNFLEGA